ncbi:MAG TPA: ATP-binding protein [Fluviicola sp.]|nr:ATP-binding protein [Fluviicola sp.]
MKRNNHFNIRFIFLLSISLLIGLSTFSYWRMESIVDTSEWQNHSYRVKLELETTFSTVKDAQSNKRGFIITGDSAFYHDFYDNIRSLGRNLNTIDSLIKDNSHQKQNAAILRKLIYDRVQSMKVIVEDLPHAKTSIQSYAGGKQMMGEIRNHILKMDSEEDRLLRERTALLNKETLISPLLIFLLLLSAIVIVFAAYYRIMNDLKIAVAMEAEREEINRMLQEKNELLNKSEEQLLTIFDNNPVAISVGEIGSNRIVSVNKRFCSTFGYSEEEVIGRTSEELKLTSDEENARLIPIIMSYIDDGRSIEELKKLPLEETQKLLIKLREEMFRNGFEVKYTRKDGETFFAMVYFEIIERGAHSYAITSYQDITERKMAEEKIIQTTRQLLQAQRIARIGNWEIDVKTNEITWSEELYRIYGLEPGEIMLTNDELAKYNHIADREKIRKILANAIKDKQPFNFDYSIITPNQEIKVLNTFGEVVVDEFGNAIKLTGTSQDVTERVQIIDKLHETEKITKAKQQFLANMSHEIRTPMNSIIGFANVLLRTDLTADQREYITAIKESGDALLVIINDILDIAKVDAGKMTFEKIPFNLCNSVSTSILMLEGKIKEQNLELVKEFDKTIPPIIIGDPTRLRQIILNLLSNAVKFTEVGKITVGVKKLKEDAETVTLKLTVSDTGIGIPEDKLEHIFESFEQASNETSRKYGGTGLGLAIVKKLVELQGGTIELITKEGEGSSFSIVMDFGKANSETAVETEVTFHRDSGTKNIRVLVAEDNGLNQLLIKIQLKDFGFECDIAPNGKVAIEKLRENQYDIVLMDIQMPEMNGFETTKYIRNELKSSIPIIALTADVTSPDLKKSKLSGMNDYLSKPIDDRLLYNKIMRYAKRNDE